MWVSLVSESGCHVLTWRGEGVLVSVPIVATAVVLFFPDANYEYRSAMSWGIGKTEILMKGGKKC